MKEKKIPVTRPFVPPLEEFEPYLREIFASRQLTNDGPFHRELEMQLTDFLRVPHLTLTANGTSSLLLALKVLDLKGEIITTPFSFPTTAHSILWTGNTPVFADIEPRFLNIDPKRIEEAVTEKTCAIMATHVFGNPCETDRIGRIAEKHGLAVIYDACHTFGIDLHGQSLLNLGDLSVISFHATKVFTTIEGGAVVSHDPETKRKLDLLRNSGIAGEDSVPLAGINAKMNEMEAAFGLLHLKYFHSTLERRKLVYERYLENLQGVEGLNPVGIHPGICYNYGYFPILISAESFGRSRDEIYTGLKIENILSRKYFTPLISHYPAYHNLPTAQDHNLPVAVRIAKEVLCLPVYDDLELEDVDRICDLILGKL
jgi:dTDP-4-amino-4,6-dideoxygalactose transaminase